MVNNYISNENRTRIINLYLNGRTYTDIARILELKAPSVYAIIQNYKNGGKIERGLKGSPRKMAISQEYKAIIQSWINEDCDLTLNAIKENCMDQLGLGVSRSTIDRCIKSFSYTFKRTHSIPERRNNLEVIDKIADYADNFMHIISEIKDTNIYFIDEVGFNVSMRTREGRSLRGTTPIHIVPGIRSRNISVCCAKIKNGILSYKSQTRAYNSESFHNFMSDLISNITLEGIQSAVFVLDNVPFHKIKTIQTLITSVNYKLVFLPPYSSFLNPIKNMFSQWKQHVRSMRIQNELELIDAIDNVSRIILSSDCNNFYRNMLGYIPRCIKKEEILD